MEWSKGVWFHFSVRLLMFTLKLSCSEMIICDDEALANRTVWPDVNFSNNKDVTSNEGKFWSNSCFSYAVLFFLSQRFEQILNYENASLSKKLVFSWNMIFPSGYVFVVSLTTKLNNDPDTMKRRYVV